jgi:Ca2+:H+ antiporter
VTLTEIPSADGRSGFLGAVGNEIPLLVSLATVAIFVCFGHWLAAAIANPLWLTAIFVWLFVVLFWAAISVMRHADLLAIRFGEPYGTLVLTLAAISIEVVTISAAMLHGANNPTLARDMMFAVIMIALNGLVGLCLLLGGLSHREQSYNLQGANAYLAAIIALAVLGLVLPNYTTSVSGPRLSIAQEVFVVITSFGLYAIFLLIQTRRHREYFVQSNETAGHGHSPHPPQSHSPVYHSLLMFVYLAAVVFLAEKMAIPLDNCIERFGMPQAFGGAIVAALVLAPEALSAIRASLSNQLQRSVNILHGSVLATIGLTIPAVLIIGQTTHRTVTLGVEGGNLPLLLLTLAISVVTFTSGRTNVLQGCIHLLLLAVFVLLIFCP